MADDLGTLDQGELQRRITAPDSEVKGVAAMNADDALHVREVADDLAIDNRDDVADLEAGAFSRAAGFDLVNARGRAGLAQEGEQTSENHDGQNEIRDRTGGDDRGARTNLLVME